MTNSTTLYGTTATPSTATGATWTNPNNATGSTAGTVAVWTSTTRSVTATLQLSGYNFSSALPAGNVLTGVTANIAAYMASTATTILTSVTAQLFSGTTAIGSAVSLTPYSTTTTNVYTVNFPTLPTTAQLADLRVTISGVRGNSTTSTTLDVDYVGMFISYATLNTTLTYINGSSLSLSDIGTTFTLTVPTGVTSNHFGIILLGTDNSITTTWNPPAGFTERVGSPTGEGNTDVHIWTTPSGQAAGNTLAFTRTSGQGGMYWSQIWFDASGADVALVGTVTTRGGTIMSTDTCASITTTQANQPVLIIATDRATSTTGVSGISPANVRQDYYNHDSGTVVSHVVYDMTQAAAGATGAFTVTFAGTGSGNGSGLLLALNPAGAAPAYNKTQFLSFF